jgi:hypothetical protein
MSEEELEEEDDGGGRSEPPSTFTELEGNTARKYFKRFAVNSNMTSAISSIQNKVYVFQAKSEGSATHLMNMWKKCSGLHS